MKHWHMGVRVSSMSLCMDNLGREYPGTMSVTFGGTISWKEKKPNVNQPSWTAKTCCLSCTHQVQQVSQKALYIRVVAIWFLPNTLLRMYFNISLAKSIGARQMQD